MRILVAFEESGRVRDAFIAKGHDAMSCDLKPTSIPGPHYQGDVFDIINDGWDMMIAHPVCKYLCLSSAGWFYHPDDKHLANEDKRPHPDYPNRMEDFQNGVDDFKRIQAANIPKVCIENSTPLGRTIWQVGRPDQIVQSWWFGGNRTKGAALWIKGLRKLSATHDKPDVIEAYSANLPPGPEREELRSKTDPFIAAAMAVQWGTDWQPPAIMEQQ